MSPLAARLKLNAFHSADIAYSFGTLPESALAAAIPGFSLRPSDYDETDERISRAMSGAIVQFAKKGDPNGRGLPKWTPYASGERYLEYGDSIVQKEKLRAPYLDALDQEGALLGGEEAHARRAPVAEQLLARLAQCRLVVSLARAHVPADRLVPAVPVLLVGGPALQQQLAPGVHQQHVDRAQHEPRALGRLAPPRADDAPLRVVHAERLVVRLRHLPAYDWSSWSCWCAPPAISPYESRKVACT